jgi:hypothetical protein
MAGWRDRGRTAPPTLRRSPTLLQPEAGEREASCPSQAHRVRAECVPSHELTGDLIVGASIEPTLNGDGSQLLRLSLSVCPRRRCRQLAASGLCNQDEQRKQSQAAFKRPSDVDY